MYIWNTKALATELKQGTLSQRERFKYLFLTIFFYSLYEAYCQMAPNIVGLEPSSTLDIVIGVSYSLTFLIVLYVCNKINQNGDDRDVVDRFICLLIPLSFRLFAITFSVMLPIFFVVALTGDPDEIPDFYTDVYFDVISVFITIWLYWRLLYWFRWISHGTAPMEQQ